MNPCSEFFLKSVHIKKQARLFMADVTGINFGLTWPRLFQVHVVADAVSSRSQTDRHLALRRMEQIGAFVNTTESVVLSLVGDAKHPKFKEIQALIRTLPNDTNLVHAAADNLTNWWNAVYTIFLILSNELSLSDLFASDVRNANK